LARTLPADASRIPMPPFTLDDQLAAIDAAFRIDDLAMEDRTHLRSTLGRDGIGIVPEIQSVHVAMVEPQADMVWVVDALARTRLEREPARDERALCRADWEEGRFLQRRGVDVRRERLPVHRDIHASRGFVRRHGDALRLSGERCGCQKGAEREGQSDSIFA